MYKQHSPRSDCSYYSLIREYYCLLYPLFYFNCAVAVSVLCLFLTVPWAGLQSVIVGFPGHTYLLTFLNLCSVLVRLANTEVTG